MLPHIQWFIAGCTYTAIKSHWMTSREREEMSDMQRLVIDHCFDQFFTLLLRGGYSEHQLWKFMEELNMLSNIVNLASQ